MPEPVAMAHAMKVEEQTWAGRDRGSSIWAFEVVDLSPEGEKVDRLLLQLIEDFQQFVRDGIDGGAFRSVSVPDTTQTIIGAAVLHFASGDFGEQLFGGTSLFAAEAVDRRRRELREFFHRALVRDPGMAAGPVDSS